MKLSIEERQWLDLNVPDGEWAILHNDFCSIFNRTCTKDHFRRFCNKIGLKTGTQTKLTKEEVAWLEENIPNNDWQTITAEFNRIFSHKRALESLQAACYWRGIHAKGTGANGEPWNTKPVGSEHYFNNRTGKLVKTETGKWVTKQRYVYEQHYGKIPEGCDIVFLDKNTLNFDIDNLFAVSRRAISAMRIYKKQWDWFRTKDPQLNKAMWMWVELHVTSKGVQSDGI